MSCSKCLSFALSIYCYDGQVFKLFSESKKDVLIRPAKSCLFALTTLLALATPVFADTISQSKIYDAARQSVGKEMWKGYGLPNGKLGCASSLSNVLKLGGVQGVHTPLVTVARNQLLAHRGCSERTVRNGEGAEISEKKLLNDCRPGDIILAFMAPPNKPNGGANAHCGIMGQGTTIYTNNWNDGKWTALDIHLMFDYYPYVRLLRLP